MSLPVLSLTQLFVGFGFPYEGPAPLEAIANGCIFLQPKFTPPHSSLNHEFFKGKPTSRQVSSRRSSQASLLLDELIESKTTDRKSVV